jgi:hypothetical protein
MLGARVANVCERECAREGGSVRWQRQRVTGRCNGDTVMRSLALNACEQRELVIQAVLFLNPGREPHNLSNVDVPEAGCPLTQEEIAFLVSSIPHHSQSYGPGTRR